MLESYSTAGISIIPGVPRKDCPGEFTHFLCSEKVLRIMQPMKARSTVIQLTKQIERCLH